MSAERLQKVLASAGIASRRDCEELITAGHVAVNGRVTRLLGTRVDPEHDEITVDGRPIGRISPRTYVMLHKPAGVVSTADDPQGRKTVVELVDLPARLFPVGRLDYESEGLLLMTDDGELTQRLTHPSYEVEKEYRALLDQAPTADALREWRAGVPLDGVPTAPAWIEVLEHDADGVWVRVVLHEGRKRQIREVANQLGYQVLRLIRVREGPVSLGDLPSGAWRLLTDAEVEALWAHVGGRDDDQLQAGAEGWRAEQERDAGAGAQPRRRPWQEHSEAPRAGRRVVRGDLQYGRSDRSDQRPEPGDTREAPGDRPPRRDDRPYNDRPPRRDDRPYDDRPPRRDDRPYNDRSFSDRPPRRDDRPYYDRPPRREDRSFSDRPRRDERPARRDDRPYDDRPRRDDRSFNDRPPRRDDRSFSDRSPRRDDRSFSDRSFSDRPRREDRSFGDRPPRREDRPYNARGGRRDSDQRGGGAGRRDESRGTAGGPYRERPRAERSGGEGDQRRPDQPERGNERPPAYDPRQEKRGPGREWHARQQEQHLRKQSSNTRRNRPSRSGERGGTQKRGDFSPRPRTRKDDQDES